MQISPTLLAAQQVAREARSRLQMAPYPKIASAAQLHDAKASGPPSGTSGGVSAEASAIAPGQGAITPAHLGVHVDITV